MGLKWSAVDFANDTLTIQHTVVLQKKVVRKDKTKNRTSNRVYPLLPEVRDILECIKKQQEENRKTFGNCYEESDYIFVKKNGKQYYPSYPTHELAKIIGKNKLEHIRWHDLRHSTASFLIRKGWQMKEISDWLGHQSIETTMNIYGHLSMEHKREISKGLNGLLN
jgi:integrase